MLSAPLPRPANGERIEVRGIRKRLFRRRVKDRINSLWIALDCCERRRRSLNVFFGDTYGTEISRATNFAGSIRSKITFWISIVPARSWLSN
jgi:hypothetical protein